MNFLADNNQAGQALLKLVARGNSILSEILRLKDVVPEIYRNPTKAEQRKYGELINLDFNYFRHGNVDQEEMYERKIEANAALASADLELKETYSKLMSRFYRLFDSINSYSRDLKYLVDDLENGAFIHANSLEAVFLNEDGKQLLCESIYLYGCMLLTTDLHIEGAVRERLIVGHYRYSGAEPNIESICGLLRSTGHTAGGRRPDNYPENYLNRIPMPQNYVLMVIGRLRSDDIYNQLLCYQNPEHRAAALAGQAAMLYVVLYFQPKILANEAAVMREIVDKFFPDNWVTSYYMGSTVNLVEAWNPYKAARLALGNTLEAANVNKVAARHKGQLSKLLPEVKKVLKEGVLSEETVLDQSVKMMNLIKDCNVTLRWIMLHVTPLTGSAEKDKRCRQFRDAVVQETNFGNGSKLFSLLTSTAQFEFRFGRIYKNMLNRKEKKWETARDEARKRTQELALVFGSDNVVSRVDRSDRLHKWFRELDGQLSGLELDDDRPSVGTISQMIDALQGAEDLERIEANWHVKQLIHETKKFLRQMIRVDGATDDVLIDLQIVGDLQYAWGAVVDFYTPIMQHGVKKDPTLVGKLRATFLKLATAMEQPVLRISQAKSRDLISVSQYYSSELVSYVRKVLQIIPESLFKVLEQIIRLQTEKMLQVPTRLDKDKLRDFAQLQQRFEVAKLTHTISSFTEGMLSMKSTLVGVIKVDPKQLLEDGIRKEMVSQVTLAMHQGLNFYQKNKVSDIIQKLTTLSKIMNGYRISFEYISDYVGIAGLGLSVWNTELARIFNFVVEQESNLISQSKVLASESSYQSRSIPIPTTIIGGDGSSATFLGRLINELMALTCPKNTVYVPARATWYDNKTNGEIARLTSLPQLLESAISLYGVVGIDKLLALRAANVHLKQVFIQVADARIFREKSWIDMLDNLADSLNTGNVIGNPAKFYHQQHVVRAARQLNNLSESLVKLGQVQLLRKSLSYQVAIMSSYDSKLLNSSLKNLNKIVVGEQTAKIRENATGGGDNSLLTELSRFLCLSGICDPEIQIYVDGKPGPRLAELIFLVVISTLSRLQFTPSAGELAAKKPNEMLDGHPFALGVACLLQQYPADIFETVCTYMAQYIRSYCGEQVGKPTSNSPQEVVSALFFMERLFEIKKSPKELLEKLLPRPICDFG